MVQTKFKTLMREKLKRYWSTVLLLSIIQNCSKSHYITIQITNKHMTEQNQRKPITELHLNTLSVSEYSKLILYVVFFSSCTSFKTLLLNTTYVVYIGDGVFLFSKITHGLKHDILQQILFSDIILIIFLDYSSVLRLFLVVIYWIF